MASLGSNVESFIKGFGMTGNSLIDTLILANIIPMIVSYSNNLLSLFNRLIWFIVEYLRFHLQLFPNQ